MFSVLCKNLQVSVGHMLVKGHSASSDAKIIAKELHNHYENSTYTQTHAQGICTNLANLHISTWKGTFKTSLNYWESQWLLIYKSTVLSNQESPAVCKSKLCNPICSNPDFLQVKHLDKLGQAQSTSAITYHNYLMLLCSTDFQLDFKRPKCSTHQSEVNSTNPNSNNHHRSSGCNGKGHNHNISHGSHDNDNKSNPNPNHISLPTEIWDSLPASTKSTISHTTTNTISVLLSKIMQGIFPKPSQINCPLHVKSAT